VSAMRRASLTLAFSSSVRPSSDIKYNFFMFACLNLSIILTIVSFLLNKKSTTGTSKLSIILSSLRTLQKYRKHRSKRGEFNSIIGFQCTAHKHQRRKNNQNIFIISQTPQNNGCAVAQKCKQSNNTKRKEHNDK